MPFKIIPGDVILHEGQHWYVFARSIHDGESIMMSHFTDNLLKTKVIIPTVDNAILVPMQEQNVDEVMFLMMQDYSIYAMYF